MNYCSHYVDEERHVDDLLLLVDEQTETVAVEAERIGKVIEPGRRLLCYYDPQALGNCLDGGIVWGQRQGFLRSEGEERKSRALLQNRCLGASGTGQGNALTIRLTGPYSEL